MALLARQDIDLDGLAPAYGAAAAGGDTFTPDDSVFLHVKNASGVSVTVTVATPNVVDGLAIADSVTTVPAAGDRFIGPFPKRHFARSTDGLATITYSAATSVTVAVLRAPR